MKKIIINPKADLIFDIKVREMCKSCKRFNTKATCPPFIESVEFYINLLPRYNFCTIFYETFSTLDPNKLATGKNSSLVIHDKIISQRQILFSEGHYFIIAFGAGSCKLCDKCSFPCPRPSEALVPIEATGINLVEMMSKFNVNIKFPVEHFSHFYRIGAIFYD